MGRVILTIRRSSGTEKQFVLNHGETIIGRTVRADIHVPLLSIATEHCRIETHSTTGVVVIEDLRTEIGTQVNGETIDRRELRDGDEIGLGPLRLLVSITLERPSIGSIEIETVDREARDPV